MLNLDNIDDPKAWNCPLVLTSPRSLAACRLVGVKPVELLPKDSPELTETTRLDLRHFLEHRRLTKLEHCRAIRRYLISQHAVDELHLLATRNYNSDSGTCSRNPSPSPSPSPLPSQNENSSFLHRENQFCHRKGKLDNENRLLADRRKVLLTTADFSYRQSSREPVPRCSKPNETPLPEKIGSAGWGPIVSVPSSPAPRISQHKKKALTGNNHAKAESRPHCDETSSQSLFASERLSESSKTPPSSTNIWKSAKKPPQPQSQRVARPRLRPRSRSRRARPGSESHQSPRQRTHSLSSAQSSASPPRPPSSVFTKCVSESGYRDRSSKCLSQQIRSCTMPSFKIASLGTQSQWRRTAEALGLSEEDQKILQLLERKALEKRAAEMSAHAARILWDREEEERAKQREWEKGRRKLEIAQRRNEDKAETKRRLASLERIFNRAQRRLAETLRRRDEEAQQRLRRLALQKESIRAEKKAADLARRAAVEKRLRHLNQELGRYQNFQAEELEERMRNAEGRRVWSSSPAIGRQTTSASLLVLSSCPKQREPRKRPSSAPGPISVTSDPRIVSVRMIRDAIERNLAASRARYFVQSEAAVRAAALRANATIKARSARARITSTRRRMAHLAKAARLRAVQGAAVARLRSRIRAGERKIAALLAAKEHSVASSRATAAVAAQLRHNLRGTLSATTFDQMAAEIEHVLRIPSSPASPASPASRLFTPDHQSHIKLG